MPGKIQGALAVALKVAFIQKSLPYLQTDYFPELKIFEFWQIKRHKFCNMWLQFGIWALIEALSS